MGDQVRVGIIGTSWWADLMFLPILTHCERADMVAICGRNRENAQLMADKYGIPKVYTDYRQMIDERPFDAIIVSTPDDTHYEMVMAALDAGLHVLCEKPVALNAEDALQMYQKAEAIGVRHLVLYTWHWLPPVQRYKKLLDEGYIGRPYHGYLHWFAEYGRGGDYMWRFDADRANGILGDLGSHLIHMSQWLLGDVASISAHTSCRVTHQDDNGKQPHPANDVFLGTLEFANGTHIQLQVSAVGHVIDSSHQVIVSLHGEIGALEVDWCPEDPRDLNIHLRGIQEETNRLLQDVTTLNLIEHFKSNSVGPRLFVDGILDDKPIKPDLYDGFKVQQVIDAALRSNEIGQKVVIPPQ